MNLYIIFIGLVLASVIIWFSYRKVKAQSIVDNYPLLKEETSLKVSSEYHPIHKRTFKESLDLVLFNDDLIGYNMNKSEEALKQIFNLSPGNGVKMLESVKVIKESNNIVWELSKEGKKALQAGKLEWVLDKKTKQYLPILRGAKGKKFTEMIRGAQPGKLAHVAKLTNIIVNAAHIISGADLSKKLNQANKKLDYLVEARKIDKLSELESLYYELQEIFNDSHLEEKRKLVYQIHNKIRKVRITCHNELEYQLNDIKDPKSNSNLAFQVIFGFDKSKDKKVFEEVSKLEDKLRFIDYCFALDFAICSSIDQDTSSLKNELDKFVETSAILESKKKYITGVFPEYRIDAHTEYFSSIPKKYGNYLVQEVSPV